MLIPELQRPPVGPRKAQVMCFKLLGSLGFEGLDLGCHPGRVNALGAPTSVQPLCHLKGFPSL